MPKRKYSSASSSMKRRKSSFRSYRIPRKDFRIARKALTVATQVKKMVNKTIENKHCDVKASATVSTAGVTYYNFLKVQQGVQDDSDVNAGSYNARIGNSITFLFF